MNIVSVVVSDEVGGPGARCQARSVHAGAGLASGGQAGETLSQSHIWTGDRGGRISNAVGGSVARVRLPGVGKRKGGGKRGKVGGFSSGGRRRLLERLHEVDRSRVPDRSVAFVTLTWPKVFPGPDGAKVRLVAFLARLRRAWGRIASFWKLEPQERGAPHFHLLVFWGVSIDEVEAEKRLKWCAAVWFELAGGGDPNHLAVHLGQKGNKPCHEIVGSWEGVLRYAGKYVGKPVEDYDLEDEWLKGAWRWPGRWWGVRGGEVLPRRVVEVEVPRRVAYQFKRCCRRYLEHQATGRHRIGWPGGQVERRYISLKDRPDYALLARLWQLQGSGGSVRPYHRRCRRSRDDGQVGMMVFLPDSEVRRVVRWAYSMALE